MLNRIEGVLEAGSFLKQRGEAKKPYTEEPKKRVHDSGEHELKPKLNDPKDNEALGSKGKEKLIDEDEEEEDLSEGDKLTRNKVTKRLMKICRFPKKLNLGKGKLVKHSLLSRLKRPSSLLGRWSVF